MSYTVHIPLVAETQNTIYYDSCNGNVLGADNPNNFDQKVDKDQGIDICNKFTKYWQVMNVYIYTYQMKAFCQ